MKKDTRTEYEKLLGCIDYVKWLYYDDESITEAIFTLGELSQDLSIARYNFFNNGRTKRLFRGNNFRFISRI